jgi:hypothetical protein
MATHQNRVFVVVSLLFVAGMLALMGLAFGSWVFFACAALSAVGGLVIGFGQKWGGLFPLAALALGVWAMMEYKISRGQPAGFGSALRLAGIIALVYAAEITRQKKQGRRAHAARLRSRTNAEALRNLADGKPPAPAGPAGGRDDTQAEADSPRPFQSIVLLTRGAPELDADKVKQRITKWTGVKFSDNNNETDNFLVGNDKRYMVKLNSSCMYMITLLHRPYWDSEDIRPYEYVVKTGGRPELLEVLKNTQGAILIDSHIGPVNNGLLGLARLAAACLSSDTRAMVIPAAIKAEKITEELARKLVLAKEPSDLLSPLCNFVPFWEEGKVRCMTRGMSMLGLPDVTMVVDDNEEQFDRAMAAVQSVAAYQVSLGKALPEGDTCEVPDCGRFRIGSDDGRDPSNVIRLHPMD